MAAKARWSIPGQILLSILKWIFLVLESLLRAAYRNLLPYAVQPKKSLNGKTVLVTGAGGGIGGFFLKGGSGFLVYMGFFGQFRILKFFCGSEF
jgi:hypothetical protein